MIGSGRTAAPTTDPDEIARRAIERTKGNPALAEGACLAIVKILLNGDLTEDEQRDAVADVYKAAKPGVRVQIDRIFNGAEDRKKGKAGTGKSTTKVPRALLAKAGELIEKAKADPTLYTGTTEQAWVCLELGNETPTPTPAECKAAYTMAKEA